MTIRLSGLAAKVLHTEATRMKINLRKIDGNTVGITFDESNSLEDLVDLLNVFVAVDANAITTTRKIIPYSTTSLIAFAEKIGISASSSITNSNPSDYTPIDSPSIPSSLARSSPILTQPVFNSSRFRSPSLTRH